MRRQLSADELLRLCGLLSVIAVGMVVITLQRDVPETALNSMIDGVRFVLAVGLAIGGFIMVIERRARQLDAGASGPVICLDDLDLRDVAMTTTVVAATSAAE